MEFVNEALDPLQRLIISYAKRSDRQRYAFLFAFDSRLAAIIRTTSEPLIGQMRLTWWRDILTKPAAHRPDGEPLVALFNEVEPDGVDVQYLLTLIDGWEVMLEDFPWDDRQIDKYASNRGQGYFGFGLNDDYKMKNVQEASKLWALWDFAIGCSDPIMRAWALKASKNILQKNTTASFDKSGRPLSILCKLAAHDVKNGVLADTIYRPATAARIVWHGVTGL